MATDRFCDIAKFGISTEALTQRGQLVFVRNSGRDQHKNILRARLRLFNPVTSRSDPQASTSNVTLMLATPADNIFPVMDAPANSRVVKWIAAATEGARDHALVYWEPTVVEDFLATGKTAEFTWQPTSELVSDLPAEDVLDHVAWLKPLTALLRRSVKLGLGKVKRTMRASYEEEWDFGPDVIE